ncbi:MAG: hypothetical protein ACYCPT_05335, partial [Acidimicrobiales bacterium]
KTTPQTSTVAPVTRWPYRQTAPWITTVRFEAHNDLAALPLSLAAIDESYEVTDDSSRISVRD